MSRPFGSRGLSHLTVRVPGGREYPVVVGSGAAKEAPDHVAALRVARVAVVTDSHLAPTHGAAVAAHLRSAGLNASLAAFPAGEANKTRATKAAIEDRMIADGLGRDSAIVAVGGGVTGDLAGFVAATYMRGIPWIQVPTSLLAMADASIGGKTGVDHPLGKNLIGAFHHPAAVLTDPDFLATLPPAEFRRGLAEVVKAGVVGDAVLFEALEALAPSLAQADAAAVAAPLARAVAVKVSVVSADEREADLRKVLNFGHTVGHALEHVSGYAIPHGEAVSIGMIAESAMAVRMGLLAETANVRLTTLLATLGLPVRLPAGVHAALLLQAAGTDKKSRGGRIEYALPCAIGEMARGERGYAMPVPDEVALECLEALGASP